MDNVAAPTVFDAANPGSALLLPLRILIVDDNKPFAETLAWMLEVAGKVETAHNGPVALETARYFNPDLVLLDIHLPVMSGYEVCKKLRAQSRNPHLKIVAQSGYYDVVAHGMERDTRFDAYLEKPVEFREIVTLLRDVRSAHASDKRPGV